ncbi:hypothetical protein [Phytomonospora endophytica]|uniref:Uncharacterized protein n=1 Tax=Phytomonospora endophytica TaxID=714109 RepID=A0A841FTI6_9ACTN|nr:hypothetical protein [Phytomonospora endophytica]MBB6039104.1 hypothetical protein [Phytomonospora endophytica]GIG65567.1 hypothetical protein Pen01_18620 [Phytomonospora endophytica]
MAGATTQQPTTDAEPGVRIRRKLIIWGIFSVGIAVLPVGFNALSLMTRGQRFGLDSLLGRGELLLIAAALAATAAGELFASTAARLHNMRLALAGFNLFLAFIACYWFGDVAAALVDQTPIQKGVVAAGSLVILCSALVLTGASAFVSELSR